MGNVAERLGKGIDRVAENAAEGSVHPEPPTVGTVCDPTAALSNAAATGPRWVSIQVGPPGRQDAPPSPFALKLPPIFPPAHYRRGDKRLNAHTCNYDENSKQAGRPYGSLLVSRQDRRGATRQRCFLPQQQSRLYGPIHSLTPRLRQNKAGMVDPGKRSRPAAANRLLLPQRLLRSQFVQVDARIARV